MSDKDYYQILQVLPSASSSEIKKAYRLLALEYHPDRNNSQWAANQFVELQEAYSVLIDPTERKRYDASRFNGQQISRRIATTPEEIRWMSEELVNRIRRGNPDRINRDRLIFDLDAVLSVYHIQLLERWNDTKQNQSLVSDILFCLQYLEWDDCIRFSNTLSSIKGIDESSQQLIHQSLNQYKRSYYWHRYKIVLAILLSMILCIAIYKLV